jgi:cation diffusion facilitator family transporter
MATVHPRVRDRNTQVRRVLLGLLVANVAVLAAKFTIGLASGSLGVLGDGVHSAVDAMNNVLALAVITIAFKAPDEDHPYGHGKFETLGALAIVVFLSISGFELVKGAVQRLLGGAGPLDITNLQLAVLTGTLVVNAIVATYEAQRGRELSSDILLADATHTRADVFITIGVLTGLLLSRAGYGWADPVVALIVAVVIAALAYGIVRRSVPVLVDEHVVPAPRIRASAEAVSGVARAYQIRSRSSPEQAFAELTIAVDGAATVENAHQIADAVEQRLREDFSLTHVVVHVEPC